MKRARGIINEFREFIMRGSVVDMGVGVVIGAAFKSIVDSFVADIIMPIVGIITGGINLQGLAFTFGEAKITYGNFIQTILTFLIIAFFVFLMVKGINKLRRKPPEKAPVPTEIDLLTEIRNLLREKES